MKDLVVAEVAKTSDIEAKRTEVLATSATRRLFLNLIAGFGLCVTLTGCGGGATASTTVTYRPSQPGSLDSEAAATSDAVGPVDDAPAAGGFGTFKGRIVVQGAVSPLPPLYAKGSAPKDPTVCGMEAAPNEKIVVNDGGLANVFIYLETLPKNVTAPDAPSEPAVFDQKFCVFKPHAMTMRTKQTLRVLNSDTVLHNTHTNPARNTPFNQGIPGNSETPIVYTRAEKLPFSVVCDIHPWMVAYHLPLDHPYAAVSGPDGRFEIPDVPAGKREFKVWHESAKMINKAFKVEIKAGETTPEIEISVPATKLAP
jgi:hypothetical protein